MTTKEIVTIIVKPDVPKRLMIGAVIMAMENRGFALEGVVQKVQLSRYEIKDVYDLIGVELTEEEEKEWGMLEHTTTDPVFSFMFSAEGAHRKVDEMKPHKIFPLIYVKRRV